MSHAVDVQIERSQEYRDSPTLIPPALIVAQERTALPELDRLRLRALSCPPTRDPRSYAQERLNHCEEEVLGALSVGASARIVADAVGISDHPVRLWCARETRVARVRSARRAAAEYWADRAIREVEAIDDLATPGAVWRQRLLADLCRWRARCADPETYGDRERGSSAGAITVQVAVATGVPRLAGPVIESTDSADHDDDDGPIDKTR